MARHILIDNGSGFVFGDSADLGGSVFDGTPVQFAAALDAIIGEVGSGYEVLGHDPHDASTGYLVYRADVGGSEAVPVVMDGQDQETIEAVERDCSFVGFLRRIGNPVCGDAW